MDLLTAWPSGFVAVWTSLMPKTAWSEFDGESRGAGSEPKAWPHGIAFQGRYPSRVESA